MYKINNFGDIVRMTVDDKIFRKLAEDFYNLLDRGNIPQMVEKINEKINSLNEEERIRFYVMFTLLLSESAVYDNTQKRRLRLSQKEVEDLIIEDLDLIKMFGDNTKGSKKPTIQ